MWSPGNITLNVMQVFFPLISCNRYFTPSHFPTLSRSSYGSCSQQSKCPCFPDTLKLSERTPFICWDGLHVRPASITAVTGRGAGLVIFSTQTLGSLWLLLLSAYLQMSEAPFAFPSKHSLYFFSTTCMTSISP